MSGPVLVLVGTALLAALLLAVHLRAPAGGSPRLRRAHAVLAVVSLLAWAVFLLVVDRVGELLGSTVGVLALAGWWCVAVGGVLLAVRERPGALVGLAHAAVVALVVALSVAYAVHTV